MLPKLYRMDDYKKCLETKNTFCKVNAHLQPKNTGNEIWKIIQESVGNQESFDHRILHRGYCLPSQEARDVESVKRYLEILTNREITNKNLTATIEVLACTDSHISISTFDKLFIVMAILYGIFIFIATYEDIRRRKIGNASLRFYERFSLYQSWKKRVVPLKNDDSGKLKSIQGIRTYNLLLVLFAHTKMGYIFHYIENPNWVEEVKPLWNLTFILDMFIAYTFTLISSWLLTNQVLESFQKHGHFSLNHAGIMIVNRYFRTAVTYITCIAIFNTSLARNISGPLNIDIIFPHEEACGKGWFHHLLFMHNFQYLGDMPSARISMKLNRTNGIFMDDILVNLTRKPTSPFHENGIYASSIKMAINIISDWLNDYNHSALLNHSGGTPAVLSPSVESIFTRFFDIKQENPPIHKYSLHLMCNGLSWYLGADFQLFFVNMIVLYVILKYKLNFTKVLTLLLAISTVVYAIIIYIHDMDIIFRLSIRNLEPRNFLNSFPFMVSYTSTYSIMNASFIGVIFGVIYFESKYKQFNINGKLQCLWALLFLGLPLMAIMISSKESRGISAVILGPIVKPLFVSGIGIGILGMSHGIGGIVKRICEWKFAVIVGNFSYCIYLFHLPLVFYWTPLSYSLLRIGYFEIVYHYIVAVILSFALGGAMTLLVEEPGITLQRMWLPQIRKSSKMGKEVDITGVPDNKSE